MGNNDGNDGNDDDKIYGSEFGDGEERGICPVCGDWNCSEHKENYTPLSSHPMANLSEPLKEKLGLYARKMLESMFKTISGIDPIKMKEMAEQLNKLEDEGKEYRINTGDPTKFEKVPSLTKKELEELRGHIKELEAEEAASENEDWELPEAPKAATAQKPKGVSMSGGVVLYADPVEDNDVATAKSNTDWLLKLDTELTNSATTGSPRTCDIFRPKPNPDRVSAIREKALEIVPRLHRQLLMAFEAEAKIARQRQQKSGTVDRGLVAGLVTSGKDDIFAKKASKKTITTAITIVVDDSSSMKDSPGRGLRLSATGADARGDDLLFSKNGAAAVLAYALGEVCQRMNIPFEVLSYQAGAYFSRNHYAIVYKSFNEAWSVTKDRIGNYRCDAGIDKPYDAAMFAARRLLSRQENRRIMFFLTDANACNDGIEELGEFSKELQRKANLTMVGVSILTDTLPTYMADKAVSVMKLEELTDTVFTKIAKIIHPS
jgi:hypothetical protein